MANTLFLSQLLYPGSCMYTPGWVIDQYKEIFTKFICNNNPLKVKYTAMLNRRWWIKPTRPRIQNKINKNKRDKTGQ